MEEQLCAVCPVLCDKRCANCKNVFYCCAEHQKKHWKEHQKDCHPFKIVTRPDQGRVLLATKAIDMYSIILKEQSIINLPNDNDEQKKMGRVCVTCGKIMDKVKTCSSCPSPVCGEACESADIHANYECTVFPKESNCFQIPSFYKLTAVVRCMLLKNRNREKYDALMTLQSNKEHFEKDQSKVERFTANSIIVYRILKEVGLPGFNQEDIATMFGIIDTNKLTSKAVDKQLNDRGIMHMYAKTCLASHSCVANARPLIQSSGRVKLIATRKIDAGEEITIDYIGSTEGTVERQKKLRSCYYFSCKCPRCEDPTELGTNFSSVKCKCPEGYLVPKLRWDSKQDLKTEKFWMCNGNGCSQKKTDAQIQEVLAPLNNQFIQIYAKFCKSRTTETVTELQALIDQYSGSVLHSNHYMLFKLEDKFSEMIFLILYLSKENSLRKTMATKCRKLLKVCDDLFPGPTEIRGERLYMLYHGMQDDTSDETISTMSRSQAKRAIADSIKERLVVAKEAVKILELDPDGIKFQGGVKEMQGWIYKFQPYF